MVSSSSNLCILALCVSVITELPNTTHNLGWRKNGWIPECRSNNVPGYTQGGSDGTNILADFAVKYHKEAAALGVDINELYQALKTDGEINPPQVRLAYARCLFLSCSWMLNRGFFHDGFVVEY